MLIFSFPCNKNNIFRYIKILSMSRLIIGCNTCMFIPFRIKSHKWKHRIYNVVYSIGQDSYNIVIVDINTSSWYRSMNKLIPFKKDFYCTVGITHVKTLLNKTGLIGCENTLNVLMGMNCFPRFKTEKDRYCIINGNCYKCCKHHLSNNILTGSYLSSMILFDNNLDVRLNNRLRNQNNHSKGVIRTIILGLLKHGEVLWDIGSGCGFISLEYKKYNRSCVVCIEVCSQRIKSLVYNSKRLNQTISIYDSNFMKVIIGTRRPDRIFIGCGLKHLWQWRLIFIHVKLMGLVLLSVVSNTTYTNVGILSCVYKTKLFSLTISKLILRLNNKIYRVHSAILFCLIERC
ncbi:Precorrin-6Y C5,15-methyltransferase [Candidatus Hodgkinia cicadicola]|uniref:Precorrin-6Y C5,15-methyltransferase n=1 Tax=Candidatus Hodgkinia cicadicola TaxID=573658 RepID=A0ABX4MIQ9_9HYPH|nr:Precorrin-6Y C5,15-methyltransferase [Candidatus Hodgkinia cicadicola]PIM95647.1 Precorrin-6Y C5,15-methyltransferase [Candidatus Hodgkinia cicadicola]